MTLSIGVLKIEVLLYSGKILFFKSFFFKIGSLFILLITLTNNLVFCYKSDTSFETELFCRFVVKGISCGIGNVKGNR